ncbi:MAG: protein-export chaperone SecB [Gammaproteobacteria bacterium]|nr:protein-export chaperone SecB [Gammaproteobacteria bacterium]
MSQDSQSENESTNAPQLVLQKIYIKDLSFESPRAVELFTAPAERPDINLQLNTHTEKLKNDLFEITLELTVTAKEKDSENVYYLVELGQAGLFSLSGFSDKELALTVNTYCPGILFPYAREAVSSMVERGGFPQLLLAPINFDAIYQQHLAKLKRAAENASSQAKH